MSKNRTKGSDELVKALEENEFPAEDRARMLPPEWGDVLMHALLTGDVSAFNFPATLSRDQVDEVLSNFSRQQVALTKAYSLSRIRQTALMNNALAKWQVVKGSPVEVEDDPRPAMLIPTAVHDLLLLTIGRNPLISVPPVNDLTILVLSEKLCMSRERYLADRERVRVESDPSSLQVRQDAAKNIADLIDNLLPIIRAEQEDYLDRRPEDDPLTFSFGTLGPSHEHSRDFIDRIDLASATLKYLREADFLLHPSILHAAADKINSRWQFYAEEMAEAFGATVTWIGDGKPQLKKASYRFLKAAIPLVTGETPSADAIRLYLTRL